MQCHLQLISTNLQIKYALRLKVKLLIHGNCKGSRDSFTSSGFSQLVVCCHQILKWAVAFQFSSRGSELPCLGSVRTNSFQRGTREAGAGKEFQGKKPIERNTFPSQSCSVCVLECSVISTSSKPPFYKKNLWARSTSLHCCLVRQLRP